MSIVYGGVHSCKVTASTLQILPLELPEIGN